MPQLAATPRRASLTARLMARSTVPTVALTIEHSGYLEQSDQPEAALAEIDDVLARLRTSTALERAALRLELELGLDARAASRLERLIATAPRPEIWLELAHREQARVPRD